MSVTVKKLKLRPLGDKEEINRVYKYIRDGQYNQALCMNSLMSQIGIAYFNYHRNFKDEGFKAEMSRILRKENYIWGEYELPKGLGSQSSIGQQIRSDFSTAIKTGLASGKRTLPTYKLSYPLLVRADMISVYSAEKEYVDSEGNSKKTTSFYVKFPNRIRFEVILGSRGKRDVSLYTVLSGLVDINNEHYQIGGSSITVTGKDIILNLTVKCTDAEFHYTPKEGRIMGLSFGYQSACTAYISDTKNVIQIGSDAFAEDFIASRQHIQQTLQRVQESTRNSRGGRGRKHKCKAVDRFHSYEKNVARTYNHKLSSEIIRVAIRNHVQSIVIESINKDDFEHNPTMLRQWSYYQLQQFLIYKAKRYGITVFEADKVGDIWKSCSKCKENIEPILEGIHQFTSGNDISLTCPCCNSVINFSENKAKNLVRLWKT